MNDGLFINKCFDETLKLYFNNDISSCDGFNFQIIKILCYLYGDIDIFNPFLTRNSSSLYMNLCKFGYSKNLLNDFFYNVEEFYENKNSEYLKKICFGLIDMMCCKKEYKSMNGEYINEFWDLINVLCDYGNISILELKNYYDSKSNISDKNIKDIVNDNIDIKNNTMVVDKNIKDKKQFNISIPSILETSTGNVSILIILVTIVIVSFGFAIVNYIAG